MFSSNPMHSSDSSNRGQGTYEFIGGISATSEEHLARVHKVFRIVVVAILAELCIFVVSWVEYGATFESFVQLIISLAVPYCGFYGARHASKDALLYFCGCNFVFAALTLTMCFLAWSSFAALQQFCDECGYTSLLTENCYGDERSTTYERYCVNNGLSNFQKMCIINTVISLPLTALYCMSFILGRNLWLHAEDIFIVQAVDEDEEVDVEEGCSRGNKYNNMTVETQPQENHSLRPPSIITAGPPDRDTTAISHSVELTPRLSPSASSTTPPSSPSSTSSPRSPSNTQI